MANWYGFARSNYFRVKDMETFENAMSDLEVEVIKPFPPADDPEDRQNTVGLVGADEFGGWPSNQYNEDTDDFEEVDLPGIVADHLTDDSVAIFQEVGAEKMRYLTGRAVAINARHERVQVSIDDIYDEANALGTHITTATY